MGEQVAVGGENERVARFREGASRQRVGKGDDRQLEMKDALDAIRTTIGVANPNTQRPVSGETYGVVRNTASSARASVGPKAGLLRLSSGDRVAGDASAPPL